jgi:hypothetical protein
MTRAEHLAWAKQRALEYVDRGDLQNAVTSMLSDLGEHSETAIAAGGFIAMAGMFAIEQGAAGVRRWIEGFN